MVSYQLYCLLNKASRQDCEDAIRAVSAFFEAQMGVELVWTLVDVIEDIKWVGTGQKYADFYHTNRFNTDACGNQAIVYFYDPLEFNDPGGVINATYLLDGRPQVQIVARKDYSSSQIVGELRHELIHSFFGNLSAKGVIIRDILHDYGEPATIEGITPLAERLGEVLPIDRKIVILESIKTALATLVALLSKVVSGGRKQPTVGQLAEAMAKFEGYYISESRARVNNNPLNLKYAGQSLAIRQDEKGFCIFASARDGWAAGIFDLRLKCGKIEGKSSASGLGGESSIEQLVRVWSEDNQDAYIAYVCKSLSVETDYKLKDLS